MIGITGATGRLGGLIIAKLLETVPGPSVAALVRSPQKPAAQNLTKQGIELRQGDYEDVQAMTEAFRGLKALMFVSNEDIERRMLQHENIVRAATAAGVGRIVYTSFAPIDADNVLSQTHKQTEALILASGLPYTLLRDNYYADMYWVEIQLAIERGKYSSASGDAGVAFITRADIARAAAAVLSGDGHANQTYNLSGSETIRPADFAELAAEISGKKIRLEAISWDGLAADYRSRGMNKEALDLSILLEKVVASGVLATPTDLLDQLTGVPAERFADYVRRMLSP